MGEFVFAAKISHVPALIRSEEPGPYQGCRQEAVDGLREISRRLREANVDTIVVFDTHWLVNAGYHINSNPHNSGVYTSHEFPHFIQDMDYAHDGNTELSRLIAEKGQARGVNVLSHEVPTLTLEYGTLVPMRFINPDNHFKVVSISAWCTHHRIEDSRQLGAAVVDAIKESDSRVAILASGSLSHLIWEDGKSIEEALDYPASQFNYQVDLRVVDLWKAGEIKSFLGMLGKYADVCNGEGEMHDTAMLFGALGWEDYTGKAEILCNYFPSWGTGQIHAVFPVG